jgi:sugar lactone lactonase YvrE
MLNKTPHIELESIRFAGRLLRRPESVLCTGAGDVFVSHLGKGISHISSEGSQRTIGDVQELDGLPWIPNGIALLADRTFLIANMGAGGGVWRLYADGRVEPFALEIDGAPLRPANFVLSDEKNRVWVTVTTGTWPLSDTFSTKTPDGYIALIDHRGARIVADGLAFANEVRIDAAYEFLYVVETFGRRIRRFRIGADGGLNAGEVFAAFGRGTFPDGIAFDAEGCLWTASIVSNRVIRIDPDGGQTLMLEEANAEHIGHIEGLLEAGALSRSDVLSTPSKLLKNISSIAFGGPGLRTLYLGSLSGDRLAVFSSPVAGLKPSHWDYRL